MLPAKLTVKETSHYEHDEQVKLMVFITNELMHQYPILRWLHSSLNGLSFAGASTRVRGKITTQMTLEGAKSGVCDLFLPVKSIEMELKKIRLSKEQKAMLCISVDEIHSIAPRYNGLYIEMKSKTGTLSANQKEFIIFVKQQGYKVVVPRSADEALAEIVQYCGLPDCIRFFDEMLLSA